MLKEKAMNSKEQIIINGVTYYKQQDINKGLDEEHYITEFHLLATHYNLLLEDYARQTQECEELKSQIETYSKMLDSTEFRVALTDVRTGEREVWRKLGSKADRYCKALEEIEEYIKKYECDNCEDYVFGCGDCGTPRDILDIINKAKGEIMEIT